MKILLVLGSKSDLPVAEKAEKIFKEFKVDYDLKIASAHRTPDYLTEIIEKSDADVFIGIAGLSAALPGAIAAYTIKPVIGVPVSGKVNLDSILSIIQMPPGIPVAGVGLDRGENAALLAIQILSIKDKNLFMKIHKYREKMKSRIITNK